MKASKQIADTLGKLKLFVLPLISPPNDDGLPQLLIGEENWSCAVAVDDLGTVTPLEGPNAGYPIHILLLVRDGLKSVRKLLGDGYLNNCRFVNHLAEESRRKSVIYG